MKAGGWPRKLLHQVGPAKKRFPTGFLFRRRAVLPCELRRRLNVSGTLSSIKPFGQGAFRCAPAFLTNQAAIVVIAKPKQDGTNSRLRESIHNPIDLSPSEI